MSVSVRGEGEWQGRGGAVTVCLAWMGNGERREEGRGELALFLRTFEEGEGIGSRLRGE